MRHQGGLLLGYTLVGRPDLEDATSRSVSLEPDTVTLKLGPLPHSTATTAPFGAVLSQLLITSFRPLALDLSSGIATEIRKGSALHNWSRLRPSDSKDHSYGGCAESGTSDRVLYCTA